MKTHKTRDFDSQHFAKSAGLQASPAANQKNPAYPAQRKLSAVVSSSPRQTMQRQFAQDIVLRSTTKNTPSFVGTNTLQRKGDSKGLTDALNSAALKPKASEADYDFLLKKGQDRAALLTGVISSRSASSNPPLGIRDMTKKNGMTITSKGSPMPDKDNGNYVFKVESNVCNETHCIAKYLNYFFLDDKYDVVGMKAADNFRSTEATDREAKGNKFEFYMDEVIALQYSIARKSARIQKKKWFESRRSLSTHSATDARLLTASTYQAISSPFYIIRTPTPGTQIARALLYAKNTDQSSDNKKLIALGSEYGSLAFNMCLSRGISVAGLDIRVEENQISFTIQ